MKKIRTLIVDDEPLARERLASLLSTEQDIELIGQCRDGEEAITAIQDHSPDLVFLDVQMPQMNGFEVVEAVGTDKMPLVIFVTAYDQHALKAFQVRALEYILKPFDRERFGEALQRAATSGAGCWRSSRISGRISPRRIGSSSSRAAGCSSFAWTKSTGSRRRATTSGCTSGPPRTCSARP